jgi:hypothetical protein
VREFIEIISSTFGGLDDGVRSDGGGMKFDFQKNTLCFDDHF